MRILFFGSSSFSAPSLKSLHSSISHVVTRKAKPRGRGYLLQDGEVKQLAQELGLPLTELDSFKDQAAQDLIGLNPDLLVVVSFGLIIPKWFLDAPGIGAINLHPSLLPRHRGPAPIQWAIRNGESETGITIIRMNERMDAGDMLYREPFHIYDEEDAESLSQRLADRSAAILPEFIERIAMDGLPSGVVQQEGEATYTSMISKEMGLIEWSAPADRIVCQVRAFVSWPTAHTSLDGKLLKVFKASRGREQVGGEPGSIVEIVPEGLIVVATGGTVVLQDVQLENRKRMSAADFARGHRGILGKKLI
jgi:methionyl-tRNA formyltransferase